MKSFDYTYGKSTAPNAQPVDVPYPFPVRQLQYDVRVVVEFKHHRVPVQAERNKKKRRKKDKKRGNARRIERVPL